MWRSGAELTGVVLAALLSAAAAGSEGPVSVLERVAGALRSRAVWTASYVQEYIPAGMTMGEDERGTLTIAWPDRALFVAGEPPLRLMGMEGRRVRLLDLEVGSCEDHTLSQAEWDRIPLVAVLDPGRAVERFTVALEGPWLVLVPREAGGVARVRLRPGPDGLPAEVVVEDASGAVNRFRLSGWHPGSAPEDGWLPLPPPDIPCTAAEEGDADADHPSAGVTPTPR